MSAAATLTPAAAMNPRTRLLLHGQVVPTLLRLAWPNTLVMLAQASVGLIETWWVSQLGTDALAGMALVFPGFMLMQMLSGGAIGGGIASAIARALGAGRREDADSLVLHALVINLVLGLSFTALLLRFGPALYAAMGGEEGSLRAALAYSDVVFGGAVLVWLSNAFASVLRGAGNMMLPSVAIVIGVVVLVPLSPLLIHGYGPVPALGIAGGGWAVVAALVEQEGRLDLRLALDLDARGQLEPDLLLVRQHLHRVAAGVGDVARLDRGQDLRGRHLGVVAVAPEAVGQEQQGEQPQQDVEERATGQALEVHRCGADSPVPPGRRWITDGTPGRAVADQSNGYPCSGVPTSVCGADDRSARLLRRSRPRA